MIDWLRPAVIGVLYFSIILSPRKRKSRSPLIRRGSHCYFPRTQSSCRSRSASETPKTLKLRPLRPKGGTPCTKGPMIEHRRVSPGIENSSLWEARLPPCAQASANRDWGSFCATETALAHSRVCRICHDYPVRAARVSKTHELPTSSLRKRADLGDISMADRVSSSVRSRMMASGTEQGHQARAVRSFGPVPSGLSLSPSQA